MDGPVADAALDVAPIVGARLKLHREADRPCPCRKNLAQVVIIGPGAGPHVASLRCATCGRHRGWLARNVAETMLETARVFGKPADCSENAAVFLGANMASSIQHPLPDGENMAVNEDDFNEMYGSKYLSAADLGGETVRSRILDVQRGEFKQEAGGTKAKCVAALEGQVKKLVINVTNANRLAAARTRSPTSWIGLAVDLYTEETVMGEGVRVRVIKDPPKKAAAVVVDDTDQIYKGDE
jgi:hypothetical protein